MHIWRPTSHDATANEADENVCQQNIAIVVDFFLITNLYFAHSCRPVSVDTPNVERFE